MECFEGGRAHGKAGNLGRLHSTASAVFAPLVRHSRSVAIAMERRRLGEAGFVAREEKSIGVPGLTDFGPVAKRSVSFRDFPKLSVSFRFVPFCSALFRVVPNGPPVAWRRVPAFPPLPGAWCPVPVPFARLVRRSRIRGEKQGRHCATRTYGFGGGRETFRFVPFLSKTFRNFPFRSVSFRSFPSRCIGIPFRSVAFRPDPSGFRVVPGASGWCQSDSGGGSFSLIRSASRTYVIPLTRMRANRAGRP